MDTAIHPKVAMTGIGGEVAVILIYTFQTLTGAELPMEVAGAVVGICAFIAGYLTSSPDVPAPVK